MDIDRNGSCALVLGLGESGLAMARWWARGGGSARESQTRTQPPLRASQRAIARPESPRPSTRVVGSLI